MHRRTLPSGEQITTLSLNDAISLLAKSECQHEFYKTRIIELDGKLCTNAVCEKCRKTLWIEENRPVSPIVQKSELFLESKETI